MFPWGRNYKNLNKQVYCDWTDTCMTGIAPTLQVSSSFKVIILMDKTGQKQIRNTWKQFFGGREKLVDKLELTWDRVDGNTECGVPQRKLLEWSNN